MSALLDFASAVHVCYCYYQRTWDLVLTGFLFSAACLFSFTGKGGVLAIYEHFLVYVLILTVPIQSIISSNRP